VKKVPKGDYTDKKLTVAGFLDQLSSLFPVSNYNLDNACLTRLYIILLFDVFNHERGVGDGYRLFDRRR